MPQVIDLLFIQDNTTVKELPNCIKIRNIPNMYGEHKHQGGKMKH